MAKTVLYNQDAQPKGDIELADTVFALSPINEALVYQAMIVQASNMRPVLAHTKDRSEVRGGGRKPWRQKGTGRARVGSIRSPIWIGGGVTFGPTKERNFKKKINKKMRQKAIFMVLSDRVANKQLAVVDELEIKEYSTKAMDKIISAFEEKVFNKNSKKKVNKAKRSLLIINLRGSDTTKASSRNLAGVKMINVDNINIIDLLKHQHILLTAKVVEKIHQLIK
ncbi:50S ribosomal protein L4 [Candidatus Parcubacteria bacterium]|nr:MAG: 50S ribosomal protein L4 [Candidatus Parcubacteria bacterium]